MATLFGFEISDLSKAICTRIALTRKGRKMRVLQGKNSREYLIRAKLPKVSNRRSERQKFGFSHCKRNCNMCTYSPKFANFVTSSVTKEKFPIIGCLNCLSSNVIYCITCKKQSGTCKTKPQYIGQTSRIVSERFNEHKSSIKQDSNKIVGCHYSLRVIKHQILK